MNEHGHRALTITKAVLKHISGLKGFSSEWESLGEKLRVGVFDDVVKIVHIELEKLEMEQDHELARQVWTKLQWCLPSHYRTIEWESLSQDTRNRISEVVRYFIGKAGAAK